jgi:hypothetical protein
MCKEFQGFQKEISGQSFSIRPRLPTGMQIDLFPENFTKPKHKPSSIVLLPSPQNASFVKGCLRKSWGYKLMRTDFGDIEDPQWLKPD